MIDAARFWKRVVKGPGDRCWIWTGGISDDGYGVVWDRGADGKGHVLRAHRVAYSLVVGEPAGVVMHTCDIPVCCRISTDPGLRPHLVDATQGDNLRDMVSKRRGFGGDRVAARHGGLNRTERAALSRALRDAVRDGWSDDRVRAALDRPGLPTPLFDL